MDEFSKEWGDFCRTKKVIVHELLKTFLFPDVGEGDEDVPFLGSPVCNLLKETMPASFIENKITSLKGAKRAACTEGSERGVAIVFDDAIVVIGKVITCSNESVVFTKVVRDRGCLPGVGERNLSLFDAMCGYLRVDVKLAKRFDFGIKKFNPQWSGGMP